MKVLVVFAVYFIAVSFSTFQIEATKVGECELKSYAQRVFPCQTNFIQSVQKNPQTDCSVEIQAYVSCGAKAISPCFPSVSESYLKGILQKAATKELLCDRAGLEIPVPAGIQPNMTICKTTSGAYLDRLNACADKIIKMWQANKADEKLCSEYVNVKRCQIKVIKTDFACVEKTINDVLEQYFGDHENFNPFCENGVDPSSAVLTAPSCTLFVFVIFASLVNLLKF